MGAITTNESHRVHILKQYCVIYLILVIELFLQDQIKFKDNT